MMISEDQQSYIRSMGLNHSCLGKKGSFCGQRLEHYTFVNKSITLKTTLTLNLTTMYNHLKDDRTRLTRCVDIKCVCPPWSARDDHRKRNDAGMVEMASTFSTPKLRQMDDSFFSLPAERHAMKLLARLFCCQRALETDIIVETSCDSNHYFGEKIRRFFCYSSNVKAALCSNDPGYFNITVL
ncbi:hypothetical protein AVEN_64976-1 [Araneus ventricosus]|uniref:Uncharacterized protein n=1 Tax=Araneus ventricosus TaxID=182803 RepID=A0A4Y2EM22_ARAVE|nr:hypothetical protein AVEN_41383-1 [Araneus ventricosus]GBM29587.1 hypothetical protein AVEN_64976-1 [Araneus ventricosus]